MKKKKMEKMKRAAGGVGHCTEWIYSFERCVLTFYIEFVSNDILFIASEKNDSVLTQSSTPQIENSQSFVRSSDIV